MGLDAVETVLWAEEEFGIAIPDQDAADLFTVGEFSSYIHRQLALKEGLKAPSEAQIFDTIKRFLVSHFDMKPERITRNAEFIKDLGME